MTRIVDSSVPVNTDSVAEKDRPRLLHQIRAALRFRHYSLRTEQSYIYWIKRYIHFHDLRHPKDLGADEVTRFLSYLAVEGNVEREFA